MFGPQVLYQALELIRKRGGDCRQGVDLAKKNQDKITICFHTWFHDWFSSCVDSQNQDKINGEPI